MAHTRLPVVKGPQTNAGFIIKSIPQSPVLILKAHVYTCYFHAEDAEIGLHGIKRLESQAQGLPYMLRAPKPNA